jgi:hypothetical protein
MGRHQRAAQREKERARGVKWLGEGAAESSDTRTNTHAVLFGLKANFRRCVASMLKADLGIHQIGRARGGPRRALGSSATKPHFSCANYHVLVIRQF